MKANRKQTEKKLTDGKIKIECRAGDFLKDIGFS